MPISRVAIVSGALILAAAVTMLPGGVAGAQTPSTFVAIPSNDATVAGTSQILDAGASSGVSQVHYEITGGHLTDSVIATGTPTIYGWLAKWDATTLANGTYTLQSVATSNGVSGTSAPVTIFVNNPTPSTEVVIPSNNATVSGTSQVLDAAASSGVTQVQYGVTGGTLDDSVIATATPTIYGWIAVWNTTGVADGTYTLHSVASYSDGVSGTSPPLSLTVDNPATLADLATANQTGTGTATLEDDCDGSNLTVNSNYGAAMQTIGAVELQIDGCNDASDEFTGTFTFTTTNAGMLSGTAAGPITAVTPTFPSPSCPRPSTCLYPPEDDNEMTLTLTITAATGLFAGTTGVLQARFYSPPNVGPRDIPFIVYVDAS